MTALVIVLAVVVALLTVLVAGLLRSHAEILRRLHDLDGGADAADAGLHASRQQNREAAGGDAADLSGSNGVDDVAIRVSGVDHDTVLAFLSTGCLTCEAFWEAFAGGVEVPGDARLVVVTKGADAESPAAVAEIAPPDLDLVMSSDAWRDYDVPGSPYFVQVDGRTGSVRGEGTGVSWEQVTRLLTEGEGDAAMSRVRSPDAVRARDTDRALLEAGITPGDPSLYGRADGDT